jgi:hypothetical protein
MMHQKVSDIKVTKTDFVRKYEWRQKIMEKNVAELQEVLRRREQQQELEQKRVDSEKREAQLRKFNAAIFRHPSHPLLQPPKKES